MAVIFKNGQLRLRSKKTLESSSKLSLGLSGYSQVLFYSFLFCYPSFTYAGPLDGVVFGGANNGTIEYAGSTTNINQNVSSLVVDWASFNVGIKETVNINQNNITDIILNNIHDANGSTISGQINALGQVVLVNTHGIFISSDAIINVGGLIASGLAIDPVDFLNGDYIFNEVLGTDGTVINSGIINASLGGSVALLGKQVINEGVISAQLGSVNLAAGKAAVLTFDNQGLLGVKITKEILQDELGIDPALINSGEINAESGRVLLTASVSRDVFSQAVNSGDIQQATSAVVNDDGTFTLGAGADVLNSGAINVSARSDSEIAGQVVVLGENVTHSGEIRADAVDQNAGEIELHANNTTLVVDNSVTSSISALAKGGLIKVLGDNVGILDQSVINASGNSGGGEILVGGDFQGNNQNIRNANYTYVAKDTQILNDAILSGDGGKTILWANKDTIFQGFISVRGGSLLGDGGFVETSGKENLLFRGITDRSAAFGNSGTLLLDPRDITIASSGSATDEAKLEDDQNIVFADFVNGSAITDDFTISSSTVISELDNGNVKLQANRAITVNDDVVATGNFTNNLTLEAGKNLVVSASIDLKGGDLLLTAGSAQCGGTCSGDAGDSDVVINNAITTTGSGTVTLIAADDVEVKQAISTSSTVTIRAGDTILIDEPNGSITSDGGAINLTASDTSLTTDPDGVGPLLPITIAANGAVSGDIAVKGVVNTANGTLTATTTSGYFDSDWSDNSVILTGNGNANISAGGTGTGGAAGVGAWLGRVNSTGDLSVTTSTGTIRQSLDVDRFITVNTASLNSGASTITLEHASNNFTGAVGLVALTASIRDTNSIQIGTTTISGTGATTLGIVAGGNITQTAAITNSGANAVTSLTAGNSITLAEPTNNFNQLEVTSATSATIRDVGAIQLNGINLNDTNNINLDVTAGGAITQGGGTSIINSGAGAVSNFSAAGQTVTLTESTNDFTQLNVSALAATIVDSNSIALGTSTLTGSNAISLMVTANGNGDITQDLGSTITNSGANAITNLIASGDTVSVTEATNNFNQFAATADTVNVRDANSIVLHDLLIDGTENTTLSVVSDAGSVTQLSGTSIVNNGSNAITDITATSGVVTLNAITNDFTQINLNTLVASIQDANSIRLGDITTTFANITSLQVTANGGDITQATGTTISNNSIGSITNLTASANSINVGESTNDFNLLRLSADNATIRDTNAIELSTINLSGSGGTNLTVTAGNNITQTTGTVISNSGADAVSVFNALGNDVTLNNDNNFTSVGVNANSASFTDINTVALADSDITGTNATTLDVTATGSVTQTGGTSIINNGVGAVTNINATGQSVTLSNATNDFTTVTAFNAVNLDLEDANSIDLGAMSVTGTLDVVANGSGNITQSGPLVVTGITTLTASGDDITLNNISNNFSTVTVNDADIVNIFDLNSIILGASSSTGQFNITANTGSITQSSALDINGTSSFTATTGAITLNNSTNDFTGAVSLNNSGLSAVSVVDENAIDLGSSNVGGGTLTVSAVGITQSGAIIQQAAAGLTTFNSGDGIINLSQLNNFTGNVALNNTGANLVSIRDMDALRFDSANIGSGAFTINAIGLTQNNAIIQEAGAAAVNINGNNGTINFSNGANDFTGPVSLNNTGNNSAFLHDTNGIDLGASNVGGFLQVVAFNAGDITQSDAITVGGNSNFYVAAGQSIQLNNAGNDFQGGISFIPLGGTKLANVSIANSGTLSLGNINVSNDLIVSAAGIADSGTLIVDGTAWFDAGIDSIVLNSANSDYNNVVFNNASSVSIVDLDDINVGTTDATPGGVFTTTNSTIIDALSITASGNITDTDTSILTVGGITTLNTGTSNIVLDAATNDFSVVNVANAQNVTLVDANSIDLLSTTINGSLDVTATTGDILNTTGALNVTGASNFVAADNSSVLLTNAGNRLNGAISTSSVGPGNLLNTTITNSILTNILSINVLNDLIINSTNGLTQSGLITVGNNTTINTGSQDTVLNLDNNLNTLNITNARNATINNGANALLVNGASTSGTVNLSSNGMTIAGSITGATGTNLDSTTGVMQIDANVQTSSGTLQISGSQVNLNASLISSNSNTSVNSSQGITMATNSDITATNGNIQLAAVTNVDLTSLVATSGSATVNTSTGSINDANGDQLNFNSSGVVMNAATGIGDGNALETQTSSLNVINNLSGKVEIDNTGIVNILGLKNLGTLGDITITNDDDYLINPGSIDAGYDTGELLMTTVTGSYLGQGAQPPFTNADITARAGTFFGFGGTFGTTQRPLVLRIRDSALIQTRASLNPQFAEPRPVVTDESLLQFSGLDTLSAISGEQLVEVETLAEVDQAIFTDLQNFSMEEISIRMPRDQLFEDELEEYDRAK